MNKLFKDSGLGKNDFGWLKPRYHFSFASYYNKNKMNVGTLRVLNDDIIMPHSGFEEHPHNDMEIITYVINGILTHKDSMGNEREVHSGSFQYMSAGTGIRHSEFNKSKDELRLMQLWIYPDKMGYSPNYGDYYLDKSLRKNNFIKIVSSKSNDGLIKINQDANIFIGEFEADKKVELLVKNYDNFYLVLIEGNAIVNNYELSTRDAIETNENLEITTISNSHFLIVQNYNI